MIGKAKNLISLAGEWDCIPYHPKKISSKLHDFV
jgi:hypothetical protein